MSDSMPIETQESRFGEEAGIVTSMLSTRRDCRPLDQPRLTRSAVTQTSYSVRRYRAGADVSFAFLIYNARTDPAIQLPNLMTQTKLFRDDKSVGPAAERNVDVTRQRDFSRLFTTGVIGLPPDLEPGDYYLQVVITDKAAKDKQPQITQWVNFEIVK